METCLADPPAPGAPPGVEPTLTGPTLTGPTVTGPTVTGPTVPEPAAGDGTGPTAGDGTGPTVTGPTVAGPGALRALDEPSAPDLAAIAEPVDLLRDLRVLATERPALARAEAPRRLAALATPAWRDPLARCGVPTAVIGPAFQAATREIWLWVEGDRNWGQLGSHLAGRVARRVSCSAPAGLR